MTTRDQEKIFQLLDENSNPKDLDRLADPVFEMRVAITFVGWTYPRLGRTVGPPMCISSKYMDL